LTVYDSGAPGKAKVYEFGLYGRVVMKSQSGVFRPFRRLDPHMPVCVSKTDILFLYQPGDRPELHDASGIMSFGGTHVAG
jgi:hypothetical protein